MATVVLVVLALAVGLAVGFAKRGRLGRLATPPPARNRLLVTALALFVLAVFASWVWDWALATVSALAWFVVAYYAWVNRWMPGARLVALGLAANALVTILNSGMPVSTSAAVRAGSDAVTLTEHNDAAIDESTRLSWLAKGIPVAFPPRPEVVSPGDIAVAAGMAAIIATGMTGRWPSTNELPGRRRYRFADEHLRDCLSEDDEEQPAFIADAAGGDDDARATGAPEGDDARATGAPEPEPGHATMERRA